jgi:hypothetical protein
VFDMARVSEARLAEWWVKCNRWEQPFETPNHTWTRDEIMSAFRVLDKIVPKRAVDKAWEKRNKEEEQNEQNP